MTCKSDNKTFESQMHGVEIEGIVTSLAFLLESVSESHEGVDLGGGGFVLAVASNGEEGSNQVHVGHHAIVHLVGLAHRGVDHLCPSQEVPVFLESVRAELFAVLQQQDVGLVLAVWAVVEVGKALSVDLDIVAVCEIDVDLLIVQVVSDDQWSDGHRLVVGSVLQGKPVSESHKGVNFELGGPLGPGGDGQEGANYVSVDGQELVAPVGSIN